LLLALEEPAVQIRRLLLEPHERGEVLLVELEDARPAVGRRGAARGAIGVGGGDARIGGGRHGGTGGKHAGCGRRRDRRPRRRAGPRVGSDDLDRGGAVRTWWSDDPVPDPEVE